ncbi:barwin-like endoglucanase [Basidiobolus meristosporus CBS 931.73]|uniref:Barwin-like endoglucanase n=1 Tax=Basidiobolus meristosporus CBS 931.73 TaxID=1314790 RepID=A0A1Y1WUG8_9FUNG|nr:barwin-like endoglucanase [Basidiobolus meristosporus CBS 931.73]|eukprot:ORX76948.1 barwin-like endoglucanase [Basidiobolus meristosporus CBS 931.73]
MFVVRSSILVFIALVALCKLISSAPIARVALTPTEQDLTQNVKSTFVASATGNFLPKRLVSRGYRNHRQGNKDNQDGSGKQATGDDNSGKPSTSKSSDYQTKDGATTTTSGSQPTSPSGGSGGFSGDGTYYSPSVGTSACGTTSSDSELVAAINAPQWMASANPNNSPSCGKCAKVTGPNGTVTVKIVDKCPSCAYGSLDLSPTAFSKIASLDAGRVQISWSYC